MNLPTAAAAVFALVAAFPLLVQIALALGAPWGHVTLGGRWPGRLPPGIRLAALAQAAILACQAIVALDHAGLLALGLPAGAIWIVAAISCVAAVLNTITPSRTERRLWAPATVLMAGAALTLAFT